MSDAVMMALQPLIEATQLCSTCHQRHPLTAFAKGNSTNGRQYRCRTCDTERKREWYRANIKGYRPRIR